MNTLVIYDISDDEIREKVAQICMDYGLVRIQKSAFLGRINSQRRKSLIKALERKIKPDTDNIQVFIICDADIRFRIIIGESSYEEKKDTLFL